MLSSFNSIKAAPIGSPRSRLLKRGLLVTAAAVALYAAIPGFAQNDESVGTGKTHPLLLAERERFEKEVEAALQPAQKRYAARLKALQRTLLKDDDKAGVAAVEGELERLGAGEAQIAKYPIEGTWVVMYSNGSKRKYRLAGDGRILFLDENRPGLMTRKGNDLLVDFNDGKLERFYWTTTLAVQHYDPKSRFPNGEPNLVGYATKVQ